MPGVAMKLAHPNRCPRSWTVTKITVAYNPTYLSEGLGAFDTDFVRFSFTEAPKPAVLSGQDEPLSEEDLSYRYLVQPIRLPAN